MFSFPGDTEPRPLLPWLHRGLGPELEADLCAEAGAALCCCRSPVSRPPGFWPRLESRLTRLDLVTSAGRVLEAGGGQGSVPSARLEAELPCCCPGSLL